MTAVDRDPAAGGVVRLTAAAARLARKGRPWFFADDLAGAEAGCGSLVRIGDPDGRDLGLGLYAPGARLVLRAVGPWQGEGVPDPGAFFARRLAAAVARRAPLLGPRAGVRLVHGEADDLSGLVVDSYAGGLVVQVTARALERLRDRWIPELVRLLDPPFVLAREDVPTRALEGLPVGGAELLHGTRTERVEIDEGGVVHRVRPWTGHKTGFYLDQRPARRLVRRLAEVGRARRVLDLFSYQGGFALAALAGGAEHVTLVDESRPALDEARAAITRSGFDADARSSAVVADVFDELRRLRRAAAAGQAEYDLVVCDPPAFARTRREVRGALRGYRDLNRLALRLLRPGGLLLTCTCSHHVATADFEGVVRQAAADLPFAVLLRRRLGAGDDHPVRIGVKESEYLRVLLVERPRDMGVSANSAPFESL